MQLHEGLGSPVNPLERDATFRLCARRLEDHDELQGAECLSHFDKRLVAAIDKLKQMGRWEELVNDGGSPEAALRVSPVATLSPEVSIGAAPAPACLALHGLHRMSERLPRSACFTEIYPVQLCLSLWHLTLSIAGARSCAESSRRQDWYRGVVCPVTGGLKVRRAWGGLAGREGAGPQGHERQGWAGVPGGPGARGEFDQRDGCAQRSRRRARAGQHGQRRPRQQRCAACPLLLRHLRPLRWPFLTAPLIATVRSLSTLSWRIS